MRNITAITLAMAALCPPPSRGQAPPAQPDGGDAPGGARIERVTPGGAAPAPAAMAPPGEAGPIEPPPLPAPPGPPQGFAPAAPPGALAPPAPAPAGPRLQLKLSDLIALKKAAIEAGGDIAIDIRPLGITVEDLVVPLGASGRFNIGRDGEDYVITSKAADGARDSAIEELEAKRNRLLRDIGVLEKLSAAPAKEGQ